jgi:hypothetical protein
VSVLQLGGFIGTGERNVTRYLTFQAAIDDTPDGGTLYIPTRDEQGPYTRETVPAVVPMTITKSIKLRGDVAGRVGQTDGSRIAYIAEDLAADFASDLITVTAPNARVILEDISFVGAADGLDGDDGAGAGRGLVLDDTHACTVNRCSFESFPSWAIDHNSTHDIVNLIFDQVDCWYSRSNGLMRFGGGTGVAFYCKLYTCNLIPTTDLVTPTTSRALYLGKTEYMIMRDTVLQTSMRDAANQELLYVNYPSTGTRKLVVDGCWFENIIGTFETLVTPTSFMIQLIGPVTSATFNDCLFTRGNTTTSLKALQITNDAGAKSAYRVMFSNNMALKDSAPDWVGTDDIDYDSGSEVLMMNNLRTMTGVGGYFDGYWRISGENSGSARVNDGRLLKLREIQQTDIATLTDMRGGEFTFNLDGARPHFYNGAAWKSIGSQPMTAAAAAALTWATGDQYYQTDGGAGVAGLYVCTAAPATFQRIGGP